MVLDARAEARAYLRSNNNGKSKNEQQQKRNAGILRFAQNDELSGGRSLFVVRGFEEGIFGWAANHLVEGGAGGDHGVDAVFFFYLEVD